MYEKCSEIMSNLLSKLFCLSDETAKKTHSLTKRDGYKDLACLKCFIKNLF